MSEKFTQGYALLVGVGGNLPNTKTDAVGLAELLKDEGRCAYPAAQVNVLTEAQAARANILTALDQLAISTHPSATVIVYFSGHGCQVASPGGERYYLLPHGYDVNALEHTAISGAEFVQKLRAIPAQKLLLLLDCCHAGGLSDSKAPGFNATNAPLPPEALGFLQQGRGRVVIASSTANELSFAGRPYSAFTLALIEALCGAGVAKQDGYARVADLALHAREKVPQRTNNRQHPILHYEQADNFVVAFYAAGDVQPKGLPFATPPEIEPTPGAWRQTMFDQLGQTVGTQTNIGNASGAVFSGNFPGTINFGK